MERSLKYRSEQLNRDPPSTPAGIARASGKWAGIPYLRENDGLLPPCIVAVGDRRRVHAAAKLLRDAVPLHEEVERQVGPGGRGRVDQVLGVFEHEGKPMPVIIMETNVGCSAQEMYGLEGLLLARPDCYSFGGSEIRARAITLIRVGMCCGIQDEKSGQPIGRGDIAIATSSLSDGVEVRQAMGLGSSYELGTLRRFWERWEMDYRLGATEDRRWPVIDASKAVVDALAGACGQFGLERRLGPNLSKNSRRFEQNDAELLALRRKYGVLSTEMDHFMLAFLAHELAMNGIPVAHGLISCVEKTAPALQKNERPPEKNGLAVRETEMMNAVLLAMWKMVYGSEPGRPSVGASF